jgi:hypothetical protein
VADSCEHAKGDERMVALKVLASVSLVSYNQTVISYIRHYNKLIPGLELSFIHDTDFNENRFTKAFFFTSTALYQDAYK